MVEVSTQNGSASAVSVILTAQPSSQKPDITSGCANGDGSASCSVGPVTESQPVSLHAQIAVASDATTLSSVTLTATATVVTTANWTPPAAAETTAVTAATAPASTSTSAAASHSAAQASSSAAQLAAVPLGPIPDLDNVPDLNGEANVNVNGEASVLVGAGNASSLFPTIDPSSPAPSPVPSADVTPTKRDTDPVSEASPVSAADTPAATARVAVLIVLGLAIMLITTRLSVRKRPR